MKHGLSQEHAHDLQLLHVSVDGAGGQLSAVLGKHGTGLEAACVCVLRLSIPLLLTTITLW